MSLFREIAVLPPQRAKSKSPQSADIARKQRSTARLQTDARPSRDGSERCGSGMQAYGPCDDVIFLSLSILSYPFRLLSHSLGDNAPTRARALAPWVPHA